MSTLEEKLDKANSNIETLIENLISYIESNAGYGNCPQNENVIFACINDCEKCQHDYYENLSTKMKQEFIVG